MSDNELFERVDTYIAELLAPEDDILRAVDASIRESDLPQISVSPNQGMLLHILARLCKAERILEIGTLGGYSTVFLARALPPHGRLITMEYDEKHAAVARSNLTRAGLDDRVELRVGKALDLLPVLAAEKQAPFDFVFIDADKPPYTEYFEWALKLTRPGSLIIADNVVREGAVIDPASDDPMVKGARRFNDALGRCADVTATIVQLAGAKGYDGMAIALRE